MIKGLVSIIVPTHNRAELLELAIHSVLKQTYKNWEIIIIADACVDHTSATLEKYKGYENIFSFESREPLGGGGARNFALKKARGEFVAFLDDDDEWLPEKLEKQVEAINSEKYAIIGCNYFSVDQNGSRKISAHGVYTLKDLHRSNFIGSFSFALTRSSYLKNISINPDLKACQDWDLWVKILTLSGLDAIVIDNVLVNYSNDDSRPRLTNHRKNPAYSFIKFYRVIWNSLSGLERLYALETLKRIRFADRRGAGLVARLSFQLSFLAQRPKHFIAWFYCLMKHPIFYRKMKNVCYHFKK
nr:glycosyltransferase [Bacteriovorax sp. HI3]